MPGGPARVALCVASPAWPGRAAQLWFLRLPQPPAFLATFRPYFSLHSLRPSPSFCCLSPFALSDLTFSLTCPGMLPRGGTGTQGSTDTRPPSLSAPANVTQHQPPAPRLRFGICLPPRGGRQRRARAVLAQRSKEGASPPAPPREAPASGGVARQCPRGARPGVGVQAQKRTNKFLLSREGTGLSRPSVLDRCCETRAGTTGGIL